MNTPRPVTMTIALVVFLLLTAFNLITFFLPGGPPPIIVYYALTVGGIGGLIAAVGLWMLKRWGLWLTIGISSLSILVSVPGLWIAPGAAKLVSVALIVLYALVLFLVTRPATRAAFAAPRARVAA